MLKLFSGNQSIVLVLIPFLVGLHLVVDLFFPASFVYEEPLIGLWGISFSEMNVVVQKLLVWTTVSLSAILINTIYNQHEFFEKNTYLPSLVYVLLVSFFPFSTDLSAENMAQLFFILAIQQIMLLRQNEDGRRVVFFTGFFAGIAASFLPVILLFLPFVWLVLAFTRPFVFREYLLPLLGMIIPFMWLWLVQPSFLTSEKLIFEDIPTSNFERISYLLVVIALFLLVASSAIYIWKRYSKSSVRYKRLINITVIILSFSIGSLAIIDLVYGTLSQLALGIPVLCIVLPYSYLEPKNKSFSAILFYIIIAATVVKFFGIGI